MRPAISFLKSKNFQLFVKKKLSLLYPIRVLYPDQNLSPACYYWSFNVDIRLYSTTRSLRGDALERMFKEAGLRSPRTQLTKVQREISVRGRRTEAKGLRAVRVCRESNPDLPIRSPASNLYASTVGFESGQVQIIPIW